MKKILQLVFFALVVVIPAWSQSIDSNGPKTISYGIPYFTSFLPSGKLIVAGRFSYVNGIKADQIVKLNADGQVDKLFNIGSGITEDGASIGNAIACPNDKVIIVGRFSRFNGVSRKNIVRLNQDGSVDETFKSSLPNVTSYLFSARLQSSGKIIISGWEDESYFVRRLNANGSIDNTFTEQTLPITTSTINNVVVLPNDAIMVIGSFSNFGGHAGANSIVRLTADGLFDDTYHADAPVGMILYSVFPDGQIVGTDYSKIFKLKSDGSTDTDFTPASPISSVRSIVAMSDGSVVAGKYGNLIKVSSTGAIIASVIEPSFDGYVFGTGNDKLIMMQTGSSPFTSHVIRNGDLSVDNSFSPPMIVSDGYELSGGVGLHLYPQPDGKFLVQSGASFYTSGDMNELHPINGIFRINNDFSLDNTFSFTNASAINTYLKPLHISSNGKIYIRQAISSNRSVIRLNSNGSLDTGFKAIANDFDDVSEIDSTHLVGTALNTSGKGVIVRFDNKGTLGAAVDMYVSSGRMSSIDVTPDGKWWVTLESTAYPVYFSNVHTIVNRIFRMNSNGTFDATFSFQDPVTDFSQTRKFNDNVFCLGKFSVTTNGGLVMKQLAGALTYGNLFGPDSPNGAWMGQDIAINDQYAYVSLSTPTSIRPINYQISRLDKNGVSESFSTLIYKTSDGLDPAKSHELYLLPDGSLLVAAGGELLHITIPVNPPSAPTELSISSSGDHQFKLIWTDNSQDERQFNIERGTNGTSFSTLGSTESNISTFTDHSALAGTVYYYRVVAVNSAGMSAYTNIVSTNDAIPPQAPSNLTIDSSDGIDLTLSWTDNSLNEQGFDIERSTDGIIFSTLASTEANMSTFVDDNAIPGTVYYYRVMAVNPAGRSALSNTVSAAIPTSPEAPSNLTIDSSDGVDLALSWTDNSVNEQRFDIERSTDGVVFSILASTQSNVSTFVDSDVIPGTVYYYRVMAENPAGKSALSNTVSAAVPTSPKGPSNLTIDSSDNVHVTISWTDNSDNETSFEVQRSTGADDFTMIISLETNIVSYVDNDIATGNVYHYRVRARNMIGESDYSNVVDFDNTTTDGEGTDPVTGLEDQLHGTFIYPNPVNREFHVQSENLVQSFILYQADGRSISNGQPFSNSFNIDMTKNSPGLYILKFQHSKGSNVIKIIKQ